MAVGILGYGNLGKALHRLLVERGEKVYIFSNREGKSEGRESIYFPTECLMEGNLPVEALFLAHGSYGAYQEETARLAEKYHLISAYDIHSELHTFKELIYPITCERQ